MTLENPIRAIREISHDITGKSTVRLANGRELSALDIQWEYYTRVHAFAERAGLLADATGVYARSLDLWQRTLTAVDTQNYDLVKGEIDWLIKYNLLERYMARNSVSLSSPKVAMLDLAYHDISRTRGLYYLMAARGQVARVGSDVEVFEAKSVPPQTTRARLRGDFIRRAQERRRDYTVDWVHLKLNDQAQRTVLCKDPFRSVDDRVERLIEGM
jgi:proteasome accessory factor A